MAVTSIRTTAGWALARVVYKDWIVNRTVFLVYTGVLLLMALRVLPVGGPVVMATMMASFFVLTSAAQDERNNSQTFINSLPVSRRDVVTGKYVLSIGAGVALTGITLLVTALREPMPGRVMLGQLFLSAGVISTFVSVFIPMYYLLGSRFVQLGLFVLFILVVAVAPPAYNLAVRHNFWGLLDTLRAVPVETLQTVAAVTVVVLLLASWRLSVALYNRKEF